MTPFAPHPIPNTGVAGSFRRAPSSNSSGPRTQSCLVPRSSGRTQEQSLELRRQDENSLQLMMEGDGRYPLNDLSGFLYHHEVLPTQPPPRYTSIGTYSNIFSARRRTPGTSSTSSSSPALSMSRSAPDLRRGYREGEQRTIATSIRGSEVTAPRKKTSGFSSLLSRVAGSKNKRKKPPLPLALDGPTPRSILNRHPSMYPSPINSAASTSRESPRNQPLYTVDQRTFPSSLQANFLFPQDRGAEVGVRNAREGARGRSLSITFSTPRPAFSPQSLARDGFFRVGTSSASPRRSDFVLSSPSQDEFSGSPLPPSPYTPSSIRLPLTPPNHSSEQLLCTPTICLRRPSVPDSPPISIHLPPLPTGRARKSSHNSGPGSSYRDVDESSRTSLSRSIELAMGDNAFGTKSSSARIALKLQPEALVRESRWTELFAAEPGRSETSGTLNEYPEMGEFPWYLQLEEDAIDQPTPTRVCDMEAELSEIVEDMRRRDALYIRSTPKGVGAVDAETCTSMSSTGTKSLLSSTGEGSSAETSYSPFQYRLPDTRSDRHLERVDPKNRNSLIPAPHRAYTPRPRSPGLQPFMLTVTTATGDRHHSLPTPPPVEKASSIDASRSQHPTSAGNLEPHSSLFWPRRPSIELQADAILAKILPLSIRPKRQEIINSNASQATQTECVAPVSSHLPNLSRRPSGLRLALPLPRSDIFAPSSTAATYASKFSGHTSRSSSKPPTPMTETFEAHIIEAEIVSVPPTSAEWIPRRVNVRSSLAKGHNTFGASGQASNEAGSSPSAERHSTSDSSFGNHAGDGDLDSLRSVEEGWMELRKVYERKLEDQDKDARALRERNSALFDEVRRLSRVISILTNTDEGAGEQLSS